MEIPTDKTPFIGVASQSRSTSVIAYYGIENHSKWIFTPLFRGSGAMSFGGRRLNTNLQKGEQGMQEGKSANRSIVEP